MVTFSSSSLLISVLYCPGAWKLADFGLSTEATSNSAQITPLRRGTPKYRAPELLDTEGTFTNKVDIWSLGCILHDLVTFKPIFESDWGVQEHYHFAPDNPLQIHLPVTSPIVDRHIKSSVELLLRHDPSHRPTASICQSTFSHYVALFGINLIADKTLREQPHEHQNQDIGVWNWLPQYISDFDELDQLDCLPNGEFVFNDISTYQQDNGIVRNIFSDLTKFGLQNPNLDHTLSNYRAAQDMGLQRLLLDVFLYSLCISHIF